MARPPPCRAVSHVLAGLRSPLWVTPCRPASECWRCTPAGRSPAPAIRGARRSHLGDFPPFGHGHLWQLLLPLLFKKSEIWLVCGARSALWPLCRGLALCPRPPCARHDPEPRPPRARVAWHSHWPGRSLRRRGLMCVSVSRPSPAFRPGPSLALGAGVQPATAQT